MLTMLMPKLMLQRFPAPHVPGIAPHPMNRPPPPVVTKRSSSQLHLDAHPVISIAFIRADKILFLII